MLPFRSRAVRRVSFTLPQLVAAGLALMVLSGGSVWLSQFGGRTTSLPPVGATPQVNPIDSAAVTPVGLINPRYDVAIRELEEALDAGRSQLDPETVKILRVEPEVNRSGYRAVQARAGSRSGEYLSLQPSRGGASAQARPAAPRERAGESERIAETRRHVSDSNPGIDPGAGGAGAPAAAAGHGSDRPGPARRQTDDQQLRRRCRHPHVEQRLAARGRAPSVPHEASTSVRPPPA